MRRLFMTSSREHPKMFRISSFFQTTKKTAKKTQTFIGEATNVMPEEASTNITELPTHQRAKLKKKITRRRRSRRKMLYDSQLEAFSRWRAFDVDGLSGSEARFCVKFNPTPGTRHKYKKKFRIFIAVSETRSTNWRDNCTIRFSRDWLKEKQRQDE